MIISASRRTDIPAFYSEWFFNRLNEGYVMVQNPFNSRQISKISLKPDVVDCIVFWTKNPEPMLKKIHLLEKYNYYFQFTVNPYGKDIEKNVPQKKYIINTFQELSNIIGPEKVIWRYDPILLTEKIDKHYHYKYFDYLAKHLHKYTSKCIISFLDKYRKNKKRLEQLKIKPISQSDMIEIANTLSNIAEKYGIIIESCSEEINLEEYNIKHGKCIDDYLISKIIGVGVEIEKDKNQREICGCVKSRDIGGYNTCLHNCIYCYANYSTTVVEKNQLAHMSTSPLIVGEVEEDAKVTEKKYESFICREINLFDNNNEVEER